MHPSRLRLYVRCNSKNCISNACADIWASRRAIHLMANAKVKIKSDIYIYFAAIEYPSSRGKMWAHYYYHLLHPPPTSCPPSPFSRCFRNVHVSAIYVHICVRLASMRLKGQEGFYWNRSIRQHQTSIAGKHYYLCGWVKHCLCICKLYQGCEFFTSTQSIYRKFGLCLNGFE